MCNILLVIINGQYIVVDGESGHGTGGGDDVGFEEVFRRHYKALCLFANTFLNDMNRAEDIVQEVFIKWIEVSRANPPASQRAYLYKMTRNACIDTRRRSAVTTVYTDSMPDNAVYFFQPESESTGVMDRLLEAVDSLPEKAKYIFISISVNGRKYQEVADEMNISKNTVKTQLARSLKLLRQRLEDL